MDTTELMSRARSIDRSGITPDDILLRDKVVLVTGGGGGIGQGIAIAAARFGADVIIIDIVAERCADTQDAIKRSGRRSLGIQCDVTDIDALRRAITEGATAFDGIDVLVNNAGGSRSGSFLTMPEASMRKHVDLNLVSTLVASQEVSNLMIAQRRGGAIVNVASIEASRAAPMYAVYAACKAAMVSFTKSLALEVSAHGIRVNCIAPDHTITPGMRGNRSGPVTPQSWADSDESWSKLIPLGREGLADECAGAAIWLASTMSEYVTGVTISVDGGTSAAAGWLRSADGWTLNP
jgi:NAD(P)-dependent dehydrogenase (short-subunit alcohol dehydrogenase family)